MARPLHKGRPGSRTLPGNWQAQVSRVPTREILEADCIVSIHKPNSAPVWDDDLKRPTTTPAAVVYGPDVEPYAGAAVLSVVTDSERDTMVVDDPTPSTLYQIKLPWDAPDVETGMFVDVIADPDAGLTGRTLIVTAVKYGTQRVSRILHATLAN